MPKRDLIHEPVKIALEKDGWTVTDDPYVISYGERFLFVDLGASIKQPAQLIGAVHDETKIAIEIKEFRGRSAVKNLEEAIGQYELYRLLLQKVDKQRDIYLAISQTTYDEIFSEPIGELVINDLPMQLIVVDTDLMEVKRWIKNKK